MDKHIEEFEAFMADRFGDSVDRNQCLNGDGSDYMAWDMQVAKIVWMHVTAKLEAAEKENGELAMSLSMHRVHLVAKELLSLREQPPVSFEWRQHYSSIGKSGPWVKLNDQRTYEKLKFKHAGDAGYEFRELFTRAKPEALPRHIFSILVNELRDVPAIGCKRELIIGVLNRHGVIAEPEGDQC